jgi:beta-lactam-binding protein with PASTA domain
VRACPACGLSNYPSADFCGECNTFLDWEPTPDTGVVNHASANGETTTTLPAPPRVAEQQEVSVVLFHADRSEGEPGGITLPVEAGGRATLIARVRNQSDIVDSYHLTVEGLPDGWWTIDPPTAYLLPMKARKGYEADIVIALHPPRAPSATAGVWNFDVVATSEKHAPRRASAQAAIDVAPFTSLFAAARPPQVSGRRRAKILAGVENAGNRDTPVRVEALDDGDRCTFEVPKAPTKVARGTVGELPVTVRPKKTHWIGNPIDHTIHLVASASDEPDTKAASPAVYRQRAWIPWWLPFLLLLLVIVAIVLYLLWPHHVKVPDVREQRSTFAAQKRLEKAGLTLNPKVQTALRPKVPAGTVIAQAPAPGKTVDKGKQVSVVVAAGHRLVRVPRLKGMTLTDAEQHLRMHKLTLGAVQPKLVPGAKVGSQLPHAGARRREGTPVAVVLAKKKVKAAKKKKPSGAVPAIPPGGSPAAAMKAIKAAGLKPVEELVISSQKAGTVVGTVPGPKVKPADGIVRLQVSAGFPQITFDRDIGALAVGGLEGLPQVGLSRNATVASRGAWTADGKQVAFVQDKDGKKRLYIVKPGPGARAKLIFVGDRTPALAAFAPLLKSRVLVFGTEPSESSSPEVCWMDLDAKFPAPSCKAVAVTSIDGFAWSPQGTAVLVSATRKNAANEVVKFGLLRFSTRSPFATDETQWAGGGRFNTAGRGDRGVRAASFSPDGKKLALVSNLKTERKRFVVWSMPTGKFKGLKEPTSALAGCDVDWRPDRLEWLVVRSADNCASGGRGLIVRFTLADRSLHTIGEKPHLLRGRHPAYQPINLSPGPARAPVPGTRP